jgi:hypothetical protein
VTCAFEGGPVFELTSAGCHKHHTHFVCLGHVRHNGKSVAIFGQPVIIRAVASPLRAGATWAPRERQRCFRSAPTLGAAWPLESTRGPSLVSLSWTVTTSGSHPLSLVVGLWFFDISGARFSGCHERVVYYFHPLLDLEAAPRIETRSVCANSVETTRKGRLRGA